MVNLRTDLEEKEGEINYTAVHWGHDSGSASMSDYPKVNRIQTGKTPQEFIADIKAPAGGLYTSEPLQ